MTTVTMNHLYLSTTDCQKSNIIISISSLRNNSHTAIAAISISGKWKFATCPKVQRWKSNKIVIR